MVVVVVVVVVKVVVIVVVSVVNHEGKGHIKKEMLQGYKYIYFIHIKMRLGEMDEKDKYKRREFMECTFIPD